MDMDFDDLIRIIIFLAVIIWYVTSAIMRAKNKEANVHSKPNEANIETLNKKFEKKGPKTTESSFGENDFDKQVRELFGFPTSKKERPKEVVKNKPITISHKNIKKREHKKRLQVSSQTLKKPLLTKKRTLAQKSPIAMLDNYPSSFVKGIIWSEIYGRPKAFRDI